MARISFYKDDTGCNEQDELEEGKTQGQEISEEVAAVIQERDVEGWATVTLNYGHESFLDLP